ncbi:hypothetical protein Celaphus_00004053 [Cervus elaphus hippelaphus]|uniref:Uncharacterized protein n=1 Tax=Cervus elaphus hippelaphus TaxID=46360 RepID=A0A212DDI4_CEREH|nr:hypothetical protein Celaphus_00004053 [Cervus elaphus hippelaphus]
MEKRVPAPSSPGDAGASEKCSPEGAAALSTLRIPTTRCSGPGGAVGVLLRAPKNLGRDTCGLS